MTVLEFAASALPPAASSPSKKKKKPKKKKKGESPKLQTGATATAGADSPKVEQEAEDDDVEEEDAFDSLDPADVEAEGEYRARAAMVEGRYDEAEGLYRGVLASRLDTLGEGHETTIAKIWQKKTNSI